jgi:hypothetical protein
MKKLYLSRQKEKNSGGPAIGPPLFFSFWRGWIIASRIVASCLMANH